MKNAVLLFLVTSFYCVVLPAQEQECNLPAPNNFTASVTPPDQATLDWALVPGAVGYHLYVVETTSNTVVFNSIVPSPSVTLNGLNPLEHTATVTAVCENGALSHNNSTLKFDFIIITDDVVQFEQGCKCGQKNSPLSVEIQAGESFTCPNPFASITQGGGGWDIFPHNLHVNFTSTGDFVEFLVTATHEPEPEELAHGVVVCVLVQRGVTIEPKGNGKLILVNSLGEEVEIDFNSWKPSGAFLSFLNKSSSLVILRIVMCPPSHINKNATTEPTGDDNGALLSEKINFTPENALFLSPNPSKEIVRISAEISRQGEVSLLLFDLNGRLAHVFLDQVETAASNFTLEKDLSLLPPGCYRMVLMHPDGVVTRHLVKY